MVEELLSHYELNVANRLRDVAGLLVLDICGLNHGRRDNNSVTFFCMSEPQSPCVHACVCSSEAHLVAGLLVQRDRRVIMGMLDWLPVKY